MDLFKNSSQGKLYWITGLSGSGKTTIGTALYQEIKKTTDKVIYIDGDTWRKYVSKSNSYTDEARRAGSPRLAGLCHMLCDQGFIVVCAAMAMYHNVRELNRNHVKNYVEVYVKVDIETLYKRDQKELYSSKAENVVGVDIEPELPKNPDIIIENDECENLDIKVKQILDYSRNEE